MTQRELQAETMDVTSDGVFEALMRRDARPERSELMALLDLPRSEPDDELEKELEFLRGMAAKAKVRRESGVFEYEPEEEPSPEPDRCPCGEAWDDCPLGGLRGR